jgi:hypothetical protein
MKFSRVLRTTLNDPIQFYYENHLEKHLRNCSFRAKKANELFDEFYSPNFIFKVQDFRVTNSRNQFKSLFQAMRFFKNFVCNLKILDIQKYSIKKEISDSNELMLVSEPIWKHPKPIRFIKVRMGYFLFKLNAKNIQNFITLKNEYEFEYCEIVCEFYDDFHHILEMNLIFMERTKKMVLL